MNCSHVLKNITIHAKNNVAYIVSASLEFMTNPILWWPTSAYLGPKAGHTTLTPQSHHTTFRNAVWCGGCAHAVPGLWTKVSTDSVHSDFGAL